MIWDCGRQDIQAIEGFLFIMPDANIGRRLPGSEVRNSIEEFMKLFGKRIPDYLYFQRFFIALILVAGLTKLSLSLAGVPPRILEWLSLTGITTLGFVYYSVRVPTSGFGTKRHLLPLLIIQNLIAQAIVISGIALANVTGRDNIFTVSEHSSIYHNGRSWTHAAGHLIFNVIVLSVIWWAIGSIVIFILNKIEETRLHAAARG